jgi:C1A family cysteine protease
MKIFAILLIVFLSTGSVTLAQEAPVLAPLNPDFVKFRANLQNEESQPGNDSFGTGGMPPPAMISFDEYLKNNKLKSTLFAPVYDMRNTGLLTPVRGQTSNGCWAFATIASVESRWLTLGLGSWDLSDNNLKYCHGFADSRSYYGNHYMSTAYFARRSGALIESDDPNAGSLGLGHCPSGKIPVAYITDARYLPEDMNTIKQAILDQGAIYTMMYINDAYYNASDYTYFYNDTLRINHAVDLVGWNDTKETAGGTGAWICKNSYGTGWGESGFFYISYNDSSILHYNAYWPVRSDNVPNSYIYGYDDLGNFGSTGYNTEEGNILVKYIAAGKQLLSKVGTYAMAAGTTLGIDIFDNYNPVTKALSGLLSQQSGLPCPLPGYYSFDLPDPVTIEQGNDFYIRIRYQTTYNTDQVPVEYYISGYANPVIESNVAWLSKTGADGSWSLIGNSTTNSKWDPCVKVYAESLITWNGNVSGDWNDAANWSPAFVPDASRHVVIGGSTSHDPVFNSGASAESRSLEILPNARLTVPDEITLTTVENLLLRSNISGTASFIGDEPVPASVESYIPGNGWHMISSPVSNATSGIFTGKYMQKHNESTNMYTDITSTSEECTPMKGFALWGDISGFTARYNGLLNSGNQSVSLSRTTTGNNSGWNLVGNPFPSSIDWDAGGWTKTNLNDAIYLEENGGWATYISGAGANGGTRYIAPGQGFFVNVAGVGAAALAMTNDVRVHNSTPFFKNSGENRLARLEVSGNGYTDEAIVRFMPEATADFDGKYDALKLFGTIDESAQIYTLGSTPLAINSTLPGSSEVPLGIRAGKTGTYTISATEINNLNFLTLEDTQTGLFTDLLKRSCTSVLSQNDNEKRFVLHFDKVPADKTGNSVADIYSYSRTVYVNILDNENGDIYIYTISGQAVASVSAAKGNNKIGLVNAGNYIVKVIKNQGMIVKKVFVQ